MPTSFMPGRLPRTARRYTRFVSASSSQKRLREAADLLDDFYGRPVLSPRYPPVDELVFTVLSQNTADVNTDCACWGRHCEGCRR